MLWPDNPSGFFFVELDNFRIKSESSISDLAKRFKISGQVRVVNCFYPISYRSVKSIVAVLVDVVGHEGFRDILRRVIGGRRNEFAVFFVGIKINGPIVVIFTANIERLRRLRVCGSCLRSASCSGRACAKCERSYAEPESKESTTCGQVRGIHGCLALWAFWSVYYSIV